MIQESWFIILIDKSALSFSVLPRYKDTRRLDNVFNESVICNEYSAEVLSHIKSTLGTTRQTKH